MPGGNKMGTDVEVEQAVILAGGLGTRLRPITQDFPKSMIEINGRPFLEYLIRYLDSYGLRNILLLVGYKWEMIEEYFGNGSDFGVRLTYSVEDEPLGTGGALRNAKHHLAGNFFLLFGDTYYPLDLCKFAEFHKNMKADGCITAYSNQDNIAKNNLWIEEGVVKEYDKEGNKPYLNCLDAGTSIFNKKILDLSNRHKFSLEIDIYPKLIDMAQLGGFVSDTKFYDMGTPKRMKIIERVLK